MFEIPHWFAFKPVFSSVSDSTKEIAFFKFLFPISSIFYHHFFNTFFPFLLIWIFQKGSYFRYFKWKLDTVSGAGCETLSCFAVMILYLLNFQPLASATAQNMSEVELHYLLLFHFLLKYINWKTLYKKKTVYIERLQVLALETEELEKYMW